MNETQIQKAAERASDADMAMPGPLYRSPLAPIHYPTTYFLRALLQVRVGADGVPEVVAA